MRNKKYTLEKELPKKIKLQVYKKALKLYKNDENTIRQLGQGLCLVLPCVLWELNHYLDNAPNAGNWSHLKTEIAFPEIKPYVDCLKTPLGRGFLGDTTRIKWLEEIIQNLTNEK
jgi:hypothetical protein